MYFIPSFKEARKISIGVNVSEDQHCNLMCKSLCKFQHLILCFAFLEYYICNVIILLWEFNTYASTISRDTLPHSLLTLFYQTFSTGLLLVTFFMSNCIPRGKKTWASRLSLLVMALRVTPQMCLWTKSFFQNKYELYTYKDNKFCYCLARIHGVMNCNKQLVYL